MGAGNQTITTGYNYFGSYAIAVCIGPVETLRSIWNGNTRIFSGPIDSDSADADGKTTLTTTIGLIDFYWGSATQNQNPVLADLEVDYGSGLVPARIPAYRRICYAVCREVAFGSQVVPPVLHFDVEVRRDVITTSTHISNGDINVPEAIYWLLTNTFDGFGIDATDIDLTSFEDAADALGDEELLISPFFDASGSSREMLTQLLSYIDGHLVFAGGKLKLILIRAEDTSGAPSLNESDFLDEPEEENEQFDPTWNKTEVTFSQRPPGDSSAEWDQTSETYDDPANAAIVGQDVARSFNFPWVTQRSVAKKLAQRIGIRGGVPAVTWRLSLKPSWKTLSVCDLIKVSYAKLGITDRVMRITEISGGSPSSPTVELTAIEEQLPDPATLYVPEDEVLSLPDDDPISTTPRVCSIPEDLRNHINGEPDGFVLAMDRPSTTTISASCWWTWNPAFQEFVRLTYNTSFPAKGEVLSWHQLNNGNWTFRIQMAADLDLDWLQVLIANVPNFYAVVGERKYKSVGTPKNEHQILSPWLSNVLGGRFEILGNNVIDIELAGGAWGTDDLSLEQLAVDGNYPTKHIYFGRVEDFIVFPSHFYLFENPSWAGGTSYFKATTKNSLREQDISEVTQITFDTEDPTMNPAGTFSRDWGSRADSTYESFDETALTLVPNELADINEALYAVFAGTATADQTLLVTHINEVLGSMIWNGQRYYNE